MKTIILSDINNSTESIIPYGLRLARELEAEVDVLHVVDPRTHRGSYSSLSDSQSISPGDTLSHAEKIQHEMNRASLNLDKLLSAEGSRLNYPLKINRVIVESSLEEELERLTAQNHNTLLLVNSEVDQDMIDTIEEVLRLIRKTGVPLVVVPPGESFKSDITALMPLDPGEGEFTAFSALKFFFNGLKITIDGVSVASKGDYAEMELKLIAWKDALASLYLSNINLKTNILEGESFNETISNYFKRNNRNMLLLVNDSENSRLSVPNTIELLGAIEKPALVYFPK